MSKELMCVDNIKGEFCIYYLEDLKDIDYMSTPIQYELNKSLGLAKLYRLNLIKHKSTYFWKKSLTKIERIGIYEYFEDLIKEGIIPERYTPVIRGYAVCTLFRVNVSYNHNGIKRREKVTKLFKKNRYCVRSINNINKKGSIRTSRGWKKTRDCVFSIEEYTPKYNVMIFNEAVISLLIQKKLDKGVINFFLELNKEKGNCSFEEYIDNWSERLIKEFF